MITDHAPHTACSVTQEAAQHHMLDCAALKDLQKNLLPINFSVINLPNRDAEQLKLIRIFHYLLQGKKSENLWTQRLEKWSGHDDAHYIQQESLNQMMGGGVGWGRSLLTKWWGNGVYLWWCWQPGGEGILGEIYQMLKTSELVQILKDHISNMSIYWTC